MVNDAASAASGAAIADATNAGTVNFSAGGVSDSFASLVTGGGAGTVSTNMAKIDAKDADVNVTVTDAPLAMDANAVTDMNALLAATTGTVTASISGNAADLDDLTSDATSAATNALTIAVNDAQTGATGVTALNAVSAATTGTVTASISGNAADLDDLTASGTTAIQAYTIVVNDAASAASGAAIADATNAGTVNFSAGGVSDSFASLVTGGGAGTVSTNMAKIDAKDADVNVTVTDAPLAMDANAVTDMNALLAATTGTVTASISGNAADLDDLTSDATSAATNALTIVVNDAASAASGAAIADATNAGDGQLLRGRGERQLCEPRHWRRCGHCFHEHGED